MDSYTGDKNRDLPLRAESRVGTVFAVLFLAFLVTLVVIASLPDSQPVAEALTK